VYEHLKKLSLSMVNVTVSLTSFRTPSIPDKFPTDPVEIKKINDALDKAKRDMDMLAVLLPVLTKVSELELTAIESAKAASAATAPTAASLDKMAENVAAFLKAFDEARTEPEWTGLVSQELNVSVVKDVTALRRDIQGVTPPTIYQSIQPQAFAAMLRERGYYAPTLSQEAQSAIVRFSAEGTNCTVSFSGCNAGECGGYHYGAGWSPGTGPRWSLDFVNDWNRTKSYAYAVIDQAGNARLAMDVEVRGGVTSENLHENLETWRIQLGTFVRALSNKGSNK
jgi:hypothetical protein